VLERRKQKLQYEQEEAEKLKKREAEKQTRRNALINNIRDHANKWFMYKQLSKYADELESYLATCENEETIQLLKEYIRLVKENAGKCNPLNRILQEMRAM